MSYFCGIEGGATESKSVVLDQTGKIVLERTFNFGLNPWLYSYDEWVSRVEKILKEAQNGANLSATPFKGIGIGTSGSERILVLEKLLLERLNYLSENFKICHDSEASISALTDKGGLVLITGTGSVAVLFSRENKLLKRVGGLGHLLGDEGSAYWISQKVIKALYDQHDGKWPLTHDTSRIEARLFDFFKIKKYDDLLEVFYKNFDKAKISAFCKVIALLGVEFDDAYCKEVFLEAASVLAMHITSLLPYANELLRNSKGELFVVLTGSVWKSWTLLRERFISEIEKKLSEYEVKN